MHVIPVVPPSVESSHVATRPVAPLGLAGVAWIVSRPVPVERDDVLAPVGVWVVDLDDPDAPDGNELATGVSDVEWTRARSRSSVDARRWLRAHYALRRVLGACLDRDPLSVTFSESASGQPLVDGAPDLSFSLSHAGGRALIAVSRSGAVGVDVEPIRPGLHEAGIAQRMIGVAARVALEEAGSSRRTDAFFRMWVRHEAAVKCRGVGLVAAIGRDVSQGLWVEDIDVGVGYAAALALDSPSPSAVPTLTYAWTF
jgi:4'-phosphopantetheinyl transferase